MEPIAHYLTERGGRSALDEGCLTHSQGPWQRQQLAPPGSASTTSGITAVSRIPTSMEVFWIAPDGSVQDAYWYQGNGPWQQRQLALPGSASLYAGITA